MEIRIENRQRGITFDESGVARALIWAPQRSGVRILLQKTGKEVDLEPAGQGYWSVITDQLIPGDTYKIILDEDEVLPDPASLYQPEGVHGVSKATDLKRYEWNDSAWKNPQLREYIIYELHVGTFTREGTFEAVIDKIPYLLSLGITAVELMPVVQFPGSRNWGYDGVFPYAVQNSYGGPEGLQKLVDKFHHAGIAVILDVVYNHLGPEGNYLAKFGPYFTDKYQTPWGKAVNFDDAWCDGVRNYYVDNALMWFRDFHFDALRLDAVHAIKDFSVKHILAEISDYKAMLEQKTGKAFHLIAECDMNDPRYIRKTKDHGYGMDAQWIDEFHHSLRVTSGQKPEGYYSDFNGINHLAKSYKDAYVYDGIYSVHRKKTFGAKATGFPGDKFVVFSQNHDQVGNRMMGERTSKLVSFEMQKLMAGAVMVSPYIPLIFMGEEWSAENPFLYFVSHNDPKLVEAVRKGRRAEFKDFHKKGVAPDPQSEETFKNSLIDWEEIDHEPHNIMLNYYMALIRLRKSGHELINENRENMNLQTDERDKTLLIRRKKGEKEIMIALNFSEEEKEVMFPESNFGWTNVFNSADPEWRGPGKVKSKIRASNTLVMYPESIVIYSHE